MIKHLHTGCQVTAAALLMAMAPTAGANPFECLIQPHQMVEIRSATEGIIENVLVRRGDTVHAGQVLVQLESSVETSAVKLAQSRADATGRLSSAEGRFDYANKKVERNKALQAQNFVSPQSSDEVEAERRITEAELRDAREARQIALLELRQATDMLNRRTLRSPFHGVVVERLLNPGDLAEAGAGRKPILKLAQVEPLRVEVVLPLSAYGKIKRSSRAEVTPEGIGGRYSASVSVVDSVFDSASGTFGVRLELPNASAKLPAGIRCKVDFPALRDKDGKGSANKP